MNAAKRITPKRIDPEKQASFDAENFERETSEFVEASKAVEHKGYANSIHAYMKQFRKYPVLKSDADYAYLYDKLHNGTDVERLRARDLIVYGNVRLVLKIALRYLGRGLSLEDMLQEGMIALFDKALPKWDITRGRFSTYATNWVSAAIWRAIHDRNENEVGRIPAHYHEALSLVRRVMGDHYLAKGRFPKELEVYEILKGRKTVLAEKLSLADVTKLMKRIRSNSGTPIRLDAPVREGDDSSTFGELMSSGPPKTETVVEARRLYLEYRKALERIEQAVDELPPRSAMIIRLRYGLGDFEAMTLEEVGQRYEVTRERIRQIEEGAVKALSEKLGITGEEIEELVDVTQDLEVIAHAV